MIGAGMGLITTFAMPTGWWLVGRTPERMFSLRAQGHVPRRGRRRDQIRADRPRHVPRARRAAPQRARSSPRWRSSHERGAHHHCRRAGRDAAGRRPARLSALRRHRGGADGRAGDGDRQSAPSGRPAGATAIEVSLGGIEVTRGRRGAAGCGRRRQFRRIPRWPAAAVRGAACARARREAAHPGRRRRRVVLSRGRRRDRRAADARLQRDAYALGARRHRRPRADGGRRAAGARMSARATAGAAALTAPWLATQRRADPRDPRAAGRLLFARADRRRSAASAGRSRTAATAWPISSTARSIAPENGLDIVSDGIVMGAIQVLGDGRPMVLMADRQVTGGYPKIATVIGPDLGRLAQLRPGALAAVCGHDHRGRGRGAARRARAAGGADRGGAAAQEPERRGAARRNLISGVSGGD